MRRNDNAHDALLAELSQVLTDKTEAAVAARINLRDAVCAFVAVERARGVSLGAVIQTVKEILRAAEKDGARATDELAAQLIDWCVEFHRPKGQENSALVS